MLNSSSSLYFQESELAGIVKEDCTEDGIEDFLCAGAVTDFDFTEEFAFAFEGIFPVGAEFFLFLNEFTDFGLLFGALLPPANDAGVEAANFVEQIEEEFGGPLDLSSLDDGEFIYRRR